MKTKLTLFKAPDPVSKALQGQYICLLRLGNGPDEERWYAEHSLVELSRQIDPALEIDWAYLETELAAKGVDKANASNQPSTVPLCRNRERSWLSPLLNRFMLC